MKKQIKKGFTLVELLVVIAIIAILSVVSVVGYTSFTKKAKVSNDVSLTKEMNTILDAEVAGGKTYATPYEAVVDLEDGGLIISKLTPTSDNYIFVLNINGNQGEKVLLLDENYKVKAPEGAVLNTNKTDYFTFVSSSKEIDKYTKEGYSVYLKDSFDSNTVSVSTGIDVGDNLNVSTINYSNSDARTAIVRTNGGSLNINASNDTIKHYGEADKVSVKAVANESYHEYGKVDTIEFAKGRFVAESTAEVSFINVTATNISDVKAIEVKSGAEVIAVTATTAANAEALKNVVSGNSKVYNKTDVEDKNVYVNNGGTVSMYDTIEEAITANKNATIKLLKNVKEDIVIPSDANIVLDLNGKTITNVSSDTIKVLLNAKLTINGTGVVDVLTHGMACILNNGTTVLNGGKYTRSKEASTSTKNSNGNSYYNILNHGEMTINDGVEVYTTGLYSSLIVSGYYNYSGIQSGEKTAYIEGTNMAEPKLTINGGTFSGGLNTIKIDDGSIVTINDGTFKNTVQAVIFNANKVYIYGGTFDMPSSADYHYSVESRNFSEFPNDVYTEIRGGVFDGSIINDSADATKLVIYGGTFNNSISGVYKDNRNK